MAKLFEEVIGNGAVHSASADILIHFAAGSGSDHGQTLLASPSISPSCMPAGTAQSPERSARGSIGGTQHLSPRMDVTARASSPASPPRCRDMSGVPAPLRCHSLMLRTQPVLLERLLSRQDGYSTATAAGLTAVASSGNADSASFETSASATENVAATSSSAHTCGVADLANADSASVRTASADRGHQAEISSPRSSADGSVNALPCSRALSPGRSTEVTVDDEPEVFLEMIKFVYLSSCHVDKTNVKALIHIADKYCIEDIVRHCLQWWEDNFTSALFFQLLDFRLSHEHFGKMLRQSLMRVLRSRRHFSLITADADEQWEKLEAKQPGVFEASFVEEMFSCDELPVVSEMEVIYLLARWAKRALARQELSSSEEHFHNCMEEQPYSASDSDGVPPSRTRCGSDRTEPVPGEISAELDNSSSASAVGAEDHIVKLHRESSVQTRRDMLKLLRAVRKGDMPVKLFDIEPILQILGLSQLFSTKPPREMRALHPGFMIYRGVPGVNTPSQSFGDLNQTNVVTHAWTGGSISLGAHDFVQQQEGFKPNEIPKACISTFPHMWVRIACNSWSHREKRAGKVSNSRHCMASIDGKLMGADLQGPTWDSVTPQSLSSVTEGFGPPTLRTMQSQDDWDIGRTKPTRATNSVPDLANAEKIKHKVICGVISGHMRHGIRIGQRERSSIYDIEELSSESGGICLGGSPTEVEFELLLRVQAPGPCGICCCSLVVLQPDSQPPEPLMEVSFDASAEEPLHFHLSSSHFDSNSTYSVDLNWVLRPGSKPGG
eukprot:TRINITY_DN18548_c1_g1_i1.p1 TRINITY_DN18548_c1_g1~~TRINITY_DN18548_c1_g1_i1.p1  ORF type:complete len:782 (-),score=120.18 TRINITY_DN18548_c1_g1_i1:182-2527(-)